MGRFFYFYTMFFRHTFLAWVWTVVILILCLIPGDKMPEDPIVNADKIYHAGAFALLGFLVAYGLKKQFTFNWLKAHAGKVSIIFSILLGGIIEVLQHYLIKNRCGDWIDWLFDAAGSILGVIILLLICRYIINKNNVLHR